MIKTLYATVNIIIKIKCFCVIVDVGPVYQSHSWWEDTTHKIALNLPPICVVRLVWNVQTWCIDKKIISADNREPNKLPKDIILTFLQT